MTFFWLFAMTDFKVCLKFIREMGKILSNKKTSINQYKPTQFFLLIKFRPQTFCDPNTHSHPEIIMNDVKY